MTYLVFIYGPPAAGKYTIAKALAAQLNWPLFHNHVVIDCVETLLTREDRGFLGACADVRCALTKRALESARSLVTTFVYGEGVDDAFLKQMIDIATTAHARFCAVQLYCSVATLHARCVAPYRVAMGKIAEPQKLQSMLVEYSCFSQIPDAESLVIDTEALSVEQSVRAIRSHFDID